MATSRKVRRRNAAQLAADGFAAIVAKVGMAEAVRFVQLYHQGAGDYARERHQWLDALTHDQIANLMGQYGEKQGARTKGSEAYRLIGDANQRPGNGGCLKHGRRGQ